MNHLKMHTSVSAFLKAGPRRGPRILTGDIETFPMLSYHFNTRNINISLDQVVEEFSLMSGAFKWLGKPDTWYGDQSRIADVRDDSKLALNMRDILDSADFLIAHNGKGFDKRKINARVALNGGKPYSQVQVIDTYQLNKTQFGFDSQKLAYVSEHFSKTPKSEHKEFPGFSMWRECLAGNRAAWKENRIYNITDVTSNEEMYLSLRGWYEGHPNLGPYVDDHGGNPVCPNCGSTHLVRRFLPHRTQVGIYTSYSCNNCGAQPRGRTLIASKAQRAHITMR